MIETPDVRPPRFLPRLSLFVILWLVSTVVLSAPMVNSRTWDLCPTRLFGPPPLLGFIPNVKFTDQTTHIRADTALGDPQHRFVVKGDVMLQRGDIMLHADDVQYDRDSDSITAKGNVSYQFAGVRMDSEHASLDLGKQSGRIDASKYWILQRHLRGQADAIVVENKRRLRLDGASLTSCNDGNSDWFLRTSELTLDQANNEGVAWNARLEFMHVPIFYFPYLSFPISGRKTGFLLPDVGTSTASGTTIGLPFYWNIAPDRDATITPYYYSKRGNQFLTEFRYLNPNNEGKVNFSYLHNDKIFGDDRKYARFQHKALPAPGWSYSLDGQYVSDDSYFNDFGAQLSVASQLELERRFDVHYQASQWHMDGLFQGFQTLDPTIAEVNKPYARVPQILVNTNTFATDSSINVDFTGEFVRFYRSTGVTGNRVDLKPRISADYRRPAGFINPSLTLRTTRYRLINNDVGTDSSPSRSLPQLSVDSGLFFERDVNLEQRNLLQTLEPRLYYLFVPYRSQANLIVDQTGTQRTFDSSLPPLSFAQLFRNNRFTGVDRVGDANQVTLAMTSRLLSEVGKEMLSGSLGEIIYFRDREVTLPGSPIETLHQSDRVAELRSRWNDHIDSSASLLWDTKNDRNTRGAFNFRYKQDQDRIAQLSYRYERGSIEQSDVSLLWPVSRRWKMVGRWYYSWFDEVALERLMGVEYESCCWSLRLVTRDYVSNVLDNQRNDTIWLQLELKGLGSVGKKVNELFDTGRLDN